MSAVAALAGVLASGTLLRAQAPTSGVIYACVKVNQGQVRIVPSLAACNPSEEPRTWNALGQQGPMGPMGPQGPAGPPGSPSTVDLSGYARLFGGNTFNGTQRVSGLDSWFVLTTDARGTGGAIRGAAQAPNANAIEAVSFASSGWGSGLHALGYSPMGHGVYGEAMASADGRSGNGLFGIAHATTGFAAGVQGWARDSSQGTGVVGRGGSIGVWGTAESTDPDVIRTGVFGYVDGTSGLTFGLQGTVKSPTGFGAKVSNEADGISTNQRAVSLAGLAMRYLDGAQGSVPTSRATAVEAYAPGADSVGLNATGGSGSGAAAQFLNVSGGDIIRGWGQAGRFRVSGDGWFHATGFASDGGDFAESMEVVGNRADYEPGDVMAIDPVGDRRLVKAAGAYSRTVAGVYATQPGILAGGAVLPDEVPLALVGIVPCKVTAANGAIARGDLLVVSGVPGYAMKGTDRSRLVGSVVGKALQPLESGTGTILVLVTLQ